MVDTQTSPLLGNYLPEKLAPPDTFSFSLVLLARLGACAEQDARVIAVSLAIEENAARRLLAQPLPLVLRSGLTYDDVVAAQGQLALGDLAAVFIRDEVCFYGSSGYLQELYARLLVGPEFELCTLRVDSLPSGSRSNAFRYWLFRGQELPLPVEVRMMGKKARILVRWALDLGGSATIVDG